MISPRDQVEHLTSLLAREHACMADFLDALAEFDRAKGWESLGYPSLFWFLHKELKLSKGAANYRRTAAELIEGHPEVLEPLRDGRLCLSSVFEVAKVLTPENSSELLPRFFHLSRKEAAEVAATVRPIEPAPARELITEIPAPVQLPIDPHPDTAVVVHPVDRNPRNENQAPELPPQATRPAAIRPPEVVPLDADLRRLHVTVSKRLLAKIALARDVLSHSHPGASMDTVLEVGLDLVIERHRKRRGIGAKARSLSTGGPNTNPRPVAPDRITADVKRHVWERDGGSCQWPVEGGGTCGSTLRLEIDHRTPRGLGGGADVSNLRLLCRFHNQRAARKVYGDDLMDRFADKVPRASEPAEAA